MTKIIFLKLALSAVAVRHKHHYSNPVLILHLLHVELIPEAKKWWRTSDNKFTGTSPLKNSAKSLAMSILEQILNKLNSTEAYSSYDLTVDVASKTVANIQSPTLMPQRTVTLASSKTQTDRTQSQLPQLHLQQILYCRIELICDTAILQKTAPRDLADSAVRVINAQTRIN